MIAPITIAGRTRNCKKQSRYSETKVVLYSTRNSKYRRSSLDSNGDQVYMLLIQAQKLLANAIAACREYPPHGRRALPGVGLVLSSCQYGFDAPFQR